MSTESGDAEFARAIRRTSNVLVKVAADLREAHDKGSSTYLVDYLRSDKPLSSGDRDYLADLLQGIVSRPAGRPEDLELKQRRRSLADQFKRIRQTGGSPEQAWRFLADLTISKHGAAAFSYLGFKPQAGDVDDLASQLGSWNRRPAKRK